MTSPRSSAERQHRISEIAYRIWESEGRPNGQAARHWQMAEKLVSAEERAAQQGQRKNTDSSPRKDDP